MNESWKDGDPVYHNGEFIGTYLCAPGSETGQIHTPPLNKMTEAAKAALEDKFPNAFKPIGEKVPWKNKEKTK